MNEQVLPAFIAALVQEGVAPEQVFRAVSRVEDLRLGQSITGNDHLRRAFAFEQAARLEKSC